MGQLFNEHAGGSQCCPAYCVSDPRPLSMLELCMCGPCSLVGPHVELRLTGRWPEGTAPPPAPHYPPALPHRGSLHLLMRSDPTLLSGLLLIFCIWCFDI